MNRVVMTAVGLVVCQFGFGERLPAGDRFETRTVTKRLEETVNARNWEVGLFKMPEEKGGHFIQGGRSRPVSRQAMAIDLIKARDATIETSDDAVRIKGVVIENTTRPKQDGDAMSPERKMRPAGFQWRGAKTGSSPGGKCLDLAFGS